MAGTITDIIKKIRAEADFIEETARGSFKAGEAMGGIAFTESDLESALDLAETKRKEADRLEAALKRESGNYAKLREAVKKVLDAVKHLSRTHNDDLPEDVRAVLGGIAFDANATLAATEGGNDGK